MKRRLRSVLGASVEVTFAPSTTPEERRTGRVLQWDEDGLFLGAMSLWPPSTTLELVLSLPGDRHPRRLQGEVAWARTSEPSGMFVRLAQPAANAPEANGPRSARKAHPAKIFPEG